MGVRRVVSARRRGVARDGLDRRGSAPGRRGRSRSSRRRRRCRRTATTPPTSSRPVGLQATTTTSRRSCWSVPRRRTRRSAAPTTGDGHLVGQHAQRHDDQARPHVGRRARRGAATAWSSRSTPTSTTDLTLSMCTGGVAAQHGDPLLQRVRAARGSIPIFPERLRDQTYDLTDRSALRARRPPTRRGPARSSASSCSVAACPRRPAGPQTPTSTWTSTGCGSTAPTRRPASGRRVPIPQDHHPERRGRRRLRDRQRQPVGLQRARTTSARSAPATSTTSRFENGDMLGQTFNNDPFVDLPLARRLQPRPLPPCHGRRLLQRRDELRRCTRRRHERSVRLVAARRAEVHRDAGHRHLSRLQPDDASTWRRPRRSPSTTRTASSRRAGAGQTFDHLRFDLNEDRGRRDFALREIKFADDAAFADTYPITFQDVTGTARRDGRHLRHDGAQQLERRRRSPRASRSPAASTPSPGTAPTPAVRKLPNGTYRVWMTMRSAGGVGSAQSTGPVRIERPVPPTPSFFVPLNPVATARHPRRHRAATSSSSTPACSPSSTSPGVGGVPETGVTAVVMNVTVDQPDAAGIRDGVAVRRGETARRQPQLPPVADRAEPRHGQGRRERQGQPVQLRRPVDLVADVSGYYTDVAPPGGGRFTAVTPSRVLDTRDGTGTNGVDEPDRSSGGDQRHR